MSATPRPWKRDGFTILQDIEEYVSVAGDLAEPDDGDLIVRAVNAFDALLAVAQAHAAGHETGDVGAELDALDAMDAAHPDWRSW